MSTLKPTTVPSKRLAASITASSTSLQLNNILGWNGSALTSSDFGTTIFAVLRNDTNTAMELIELDPSTIANSSITITRRGLKFDGDNTTEVSGNKLTWVKNETIVELGADTPQLFQWLKEYIDAASIAGAVNATSSVKGIVEIATQAEIDAGTATGSTGASATVTPDQLALSIYGTRLPTANEKAALDGTGTPSISNKYVTEDTLTTGLALKSDIKFGGTGADGALSITSGTTTIDLAGAAVVVKNYTSISITGTGKLAFSNPHNNGTSVVLKSQGNVTLTSSEAPMINASAIGAAAGGNGLSFNPIKTSGGSDSGSYATGGLGGAAAVFSGASIVAHILSGKYSYVVPGAGGAVGGAGNAAGGGGGSLVAAGTQGGASYNSGAGSNTPGAGGRGGGVLIIECAGAWNFSTASGISVAGQNGGNAVNGTGVSSGGGGGGGGVFVGLYNTLTANTGTVTIAGGDGGAGSTLSYAGGGGGPGGVGYSLVAQNTEFA